MPEGMAPSDVEAIAARRAFASFRLPHFSAEEPELWLQQVECAFEVAGVTAEDTRYKLLVAHLPMDVASQVKDVISTATGSFTKLATALRQRLSHSRTGKLEALLRYQQLGDQRPSQLLRRMKSELGGTGDSPADSELLRTLFLQRLPHVVRAALALLPENQPLDDLAQAADRFLEASGPSSGLVAAAAVEPRPAPTVQHVQGLEVMQGMIASLTTAVGRLETALTTRDQAGARPSSPYRGRDCSCSSNRYRDSQRSQHRSWSRGRQRSQSRGRRQEQDDAEQKLCYYHRRFGSDAHQCRSPCTWSGNGWA